MAVSAKLISFVFLLSLLLSLQVQARDSQFFSKVTHDTNPNKDTDLNNNNNNVKENEVPVKELEETNLNKKEQEPSFVPETNENSHGLYGHESGQLPPSETETTTTNYAPYTTTATGYTGPYGNDDDKPYETNFYQNDDQKQQQQNTYYNGGNMYRKTRNGNDDVYFNGGNKYNNGQEMRNTMFTEKGWSTTENQNDDVYFNRYDRHDNGVGMGGSPSRFNGIGYNTMADQNDNVYYNKNRYNSVGRQGMSDTRFLENGKYYYDISKDKYVPTQFEEHNERFYENNKGFDRFNQNQEEFEMNQEDDQHQFMP